MAVSVLESVDRSFSDPQQPSEAPEAHWEKAGVRTGKRFSSLQRSGVRTAVARSSSGVVVGRRSRPSPRPSPSRSDPASPTACSLSRGQSFHMFKPTVISNSNLQTAVITFRSRRSSKPCSSITPVTPL